MYHDVASGLEVACPDPAAGLYVRDRGGRIIKVTIPPRCLAFQVGASQAEILHSVTVLAYAESLALAVTICRHTMSNSSDCVRSVK
jgi:hypothetical protein